MTDDRLSAIFAALADPTRRAILARLAEGDATVSELAEPFPISLPAISRHLKVLEQAGLISRSRSAQWRSSSLRVGGLQELIAWMEGNQAFWDARFDRLDAHLDRVMAEEADASAKAAAQAAPSASKTTAHPEGASMPTQASQELVMTRVFNAPRSLVYKAFTDPDQLAQWYPPTGFSVPRDSVEIDARVGGAQRLVMLSDNDPNFKAPVDATFTEVIENELLATTEEFVGVPGLQEPGKLNVRIEFHDEGNKTRVVLRQGPHTAAMMPMAKAGREDSFSKLDKILEAAQLHS
jgi:uncharacterized protein YndB with AHSA1/START domain/DNA-binding transcriptional ArsR family regulator